MLRLGGLMGKAMVGHSNGNEKHGENIYVYIFIFIFIFVSMGRSKQSKQRIDLIVYMVLAC